ncbi:hypothetical protein [Desulfobacter latus]|uniref:Porin n=1 Tax=Desulfobacter latus TaxID=2292 RepID=A0A850ST65_9BACT|nr:hypothetical protein [Desulfobacter latus]NWH04574.1 hypothetical protein [Desulfobacter latus]
MKKIIVAVAALALMAGSAYAADWNFYGNARINTFWTDTDRENAPDPDTQFNEYLISISRIGAHVKVSDELTGRFEYGAGGGNANIRLLYGEWDFGAGKLLIGQDWEPLNLTGSSQVYMQESALEGFGGEMAAVRAPQIKLTFGGLQVAFVQNEDTNVNDINGVGTTTDFVIPKLEVKYAYTVDNWKFTMAGGYQTFDVNIGAVDEDVTSWGLGLDVAATFGAFSFSAQVNGGSNVGNIWLIDVDDGVNNTIGNGYALVWNNNVIDNDAIGGRLVVAYTFNEMLGVEVGYGYQETEYDASIINGVNIEKDDSQSYYIQFPITLAPGVFVVPELGVVDFKDRWDGLDEDKLTYFGAKWQINF